MLTIWIGWAFALALLLSQVLMTRRRLVLVARATHEVRGPLTAARLGLHGLAGEPGRVTAIDLELQRAGRALEDLASGGLSSSRPELVDVATLLESHAPAWHALAAAHSAEFRLDPPLIVTQAEVAPEPLAPRLAVALEPPGGLAAVTPARLAPRGAALPPIARPSRPCVFTLLRGGRATIPPSFPRAGSFSPTTVVGDPLRLAQACANLVANAAEHGGGVVVVRVRVVGEHVRVEVSDDGPGLPKPVAALAGASRGRRGHGLAVASAIAAHHGGRLSAAPARCGARLSLELPSLAPAVQATRAPVVA